MHNTKCLLSKFQQINPTSIMCSTIRSLLFTKNGIYFRKSICTSVPFSNLITALTKQEQNVPVNVGKDLSEITPYFPESFNLAAYANQSETLRNLIDLNVDISKIERKPHIVYKILKLDFEKDVKNSIMFLKDYVDLDNMGNFLTKNPLMLSVPLDDMQVRINYLKSKRFTQIQINGIITRNPFWLMFSTIRIDKRLGFFQQKFELCGDEVRELATMAPKIITYNLHHINTNNFVIKEELGFNDKEIKQLILHKPKLWMINQKALLQRFTYLHNEIKIPHDTILKNPNVLLSRNFRVKQRHTFLQCLGRAQYDATKENFIPIMALAEGTDLDFCKNYAKCTIDDFNTFLKTL